MGAAFVTVMAVLVILSLYAMAMSVRSQGAGLQTRKARYQETCDELARLALREGIFRVRSFANDPGQALFELLRRPANAGETLRLDRSDLPHSTAELGRYAAYRWDGVEVQTVRWGPLALEAAEAVSYEAAGILRVTAQVRGPFDSSSTQSAEYDYRLGLTSLPRPFDAYTFFLAHPEPLLTLGAHEGDPNRTISWAVSHLATLRKQAEDLQLQIPQVIQKLEDAKASAPAPLAGVLDQAIATIGQLQPELAAFLSPPRWPADPMWTVKDPGTETAGEVHTLHLFAPGLSIYSLAESLDLAQLDLPTRVEPLVRQLEDREADRKAAGQAVAAALAAGQSAPAALVDALRNLFQVLQADALDCHQLLVRYKTFQDLVVEVGDAAQGELALRSRRLGRSEARRRADFVFAGPGMAEKATRFLRLRPPPSGILYVDDDTQALTVDVEGLRGRLVVYSLHAIEVEKATVEDPARDAIVCISPKAVRVLQDGAQLAVATGGPGFLGTGSSWTGALLLDRLPDRGAIDRTLKGVLTRMPSLVTGPLGEVDPRPPPDASAIQVMVGPAPLFRWGDR